MPLELGNHSYVVNYLIIPCDDKKITIGKYCSLANNITFDLNGNHRYDTFSTFPFFELNLNNKAPKNAIFKNEPIIGNDVWIGCGAIIKSGIKIGDGAVIASYSLVTKDVEPYSIVGGNPSKLIKKRFSDDIITELLELKWWDLEDEIVKELSVIEDIHEFIETVKKIKN